MSERVWGEKENQRLRKIDRSRDRQTDRQRDFAYGGDERKQ